LDRVIHVDLAATVIGGRSDHGDSTASTRLCLNVWRSDRKEGRDYGTSHQGEFQVFSHSRVPTIDARAKYSHVPTRNLTEKP